MKILLPFIFLFFCTHAKSQNLLELSIYTTYQSVNEIKVSLKDFGYSFKESESLIVSDEKTISTTFSKRQGKFLDLVVAYKREQGNYFSIQYITYGEDNFMKRMADFVKDPKSKYLEGKETSKRSTFLYERLGIMYSFTVSESMEYRGAIMYNISISNMKEFQVND